DCQLIPAPTVYEETACLSLVSLCYHSSYRHVPSKGCMDRRQFVATASTVTLFGAGGCLGGALGGTDTVFEDVQGQGSDLVVTFKKDTNIRKLNLILRSEE